MSYKDFSVEDFISDEQFINWVKNPDNSSDAFWTDWIKNNPEQREILHDAKSFILGFEFEQPSIEEKDIQQLLQNIHQEIEPATSNNKPLSSAAIVGIWWRIAASILLIGTTLSLFFWWKNSSINYQTAFAQTETIILPDQSEVILNANSKLYTKSKWEEGKDREVWLEGEAYFSVQSASTYGNSKFIVYAGESSVEVLGTKFNINSRVNELRVLLTEGKVKVNLPETSEILEEAQEDNLDQELLEYQIQEKTYERKRVKALPFISWKDNTLRFEDTPISELVRILEDNYGFEVEINDTALLEESLSGSMPYGEADLVFKALKTVFNIQVEQQSETKVSLSKE